MSPIGWIVLTAIVLMVILINLSLWSAWKNRGQKKNNPFDILIRASKGMNEPWKNQDAQIQELSRRINELKNSQTDSTTENIRQNQ